MIDCLQADLAEVDAHTKLGLDSLLAMALGLDLDDISAGILVELVKFEVAVVVALQLGDRLAVADEPHSGTLDAVDNAVRLRRHRAADEALRIAPEIAVIDARLGAEVVTHDFETFIPGLALHLLVFDENRAHRPGRARLMT